MKLVFLTTNCYSWLQLPANSVDAATLCACMIIVLIMLQPDDQGAVAGQVLMSVQNLIC